MTHAQMTLADVNELDDDALRARLAGMTQADLGDEAVMTLLAALVEGQTPPEHGPPRANSIELAAVPQLYGMLLDAARRWATASDWPDDCPDPRCAEAGGCVGGLRRLQSDGPRCYPGCYALLLRALLAPETLTAAEFEQVEPLIPCDLEDDDPDEMAPPAEVLVGVLVTLVRMPGGAEGWMAQHHARAETGAS